MSEYTPTTDGVRDTYVRAHRTSVARQEFDRWLAEIRAEAAALAEQKTIAILTSLANELHWDMSALFEIFNGVEND